MRVHFAPSSKVLKDVTKSLGVNFRLAQWDDCRRAAECDKRAKPQSAWPLKWFETEILRNVTQFWVAEVDHNEVGYCLWWQTPGLIEILNIAVEPRVQRQGVGRKFIEFVISRGTQKEVELIHLEVRKDNQEAISFYESLDFKVVGERSSYYRDGMDAILMERRINIS